MIRIDRELDQMEQTVCKMGQRVMRMHQKIVELIIKNDKDKALEVVKSDDFINHMEEEINDLAVGALALLSPVASDLRRVVAGIKIASELERIADYAKNIAIFLVKHEEIEQQILDTCEQMEKSFLKMLEVTMTAYEEKDVEKAFEIPEMDREIDQLLLEMSVKIKNDNDINLCKNVFELGAMLRNIERAGDHTTNICEHIIYMLKGQHYDFG